MAIRNVRMRGDAILGKKCRPVESMTPKIKELIEDMIETMYEYMGVGLAAPQVGVLKRIIVIDAGEGARAYINPEIIETEGTQTGEEGCLSVPGLAGTVTRPFHVKVRACDENMEVFEMEGDELLARAICHELDHLDGRLYTALVEGELHSTLDEDIEE